MQSLYQRLLSKSTELKTVDNLVSSSGLLNDITKALQGAGYPVAQMSMRNKSILFAALCDIIVVVRDKDYYLATFNCDKVVDLMRRGVIMPQDGERDLSSAERVMRNNTRDVVNQFLQQGKFHLIKLSVFERSRTSFSLFSVSSMNPYPGLETERVYSMRKLSEWMATLYNELIKGCYKLKMRNGSEELCQSYLSPTRSVSSGGILITHDLNGNVKELPVWDIVGYEAYSPDDFVTKLYRGVVNYDGHDITLNRSILNKYYGENLVNTRLESKGVRARYCLEEILNISSQRQHPTSYIRKYALAGDIDHCDTVYELECKLRSMISKEKPFDSGIINARVLTSPRAILKGHVSYYIKINVSKLGRHSVNPVENIMDVMPKPYWYFGVAEKSGYQGVSISAVSDNTAIKYGAEAFEKRFGSKPEFVGLTCCGKRVKGGVAIQFSYSDQCQLFKLISCGYKARYTEYSNLIFRVLKQNRLQCNDETLQLVFINGLAMKYPDVSKLEFVPFILEFIGFCTLLGDPEKLQKKLFEAKCYSSYLSAKKEYQVLCSRWPDLSGFHVVETPSGHEAVTKFARYRIGKQGINKTVTLLYRGEVLTKKQIRV